MPNLRLQRRVMGILLREGFTRPILVGERKAYSELGRTAEERRRARVKSASGREIAAQRRFKSSASVLTSVCGFGNI